MSKHWKIFLAVLLGLSMATPAMAMKFEFHGDLNNRFLLYTDQAGFFQTPAAGASLNTVLDKEDRPDSFGEIKSRLIVEASTDDGKVKGVYALEVGAVKFGQTDRGGSFSGDGINLETRWFYTDFQIPSVASKARVQIGLFTNTVNPFFWSETAMGVKLYGENWYFAWLRGKDSFPTGANQNWGDNDLDTLNARYDLKVEPVKVGFFLSYLTQKTDATSIASFTTTFGRNEVKLFPTADFDLLAVGIDGGFSTGTSFGKVFLNWDLIYETGGVDNVGSAGNDVDIQGYLLHADLGLNFGAATLTYTVWYASGDDNSSDRDFDNFMSVDVDLFESFIFQESLTDDNVFFEGPYVGDKGLLFNKLALDYQATKKTKLGLAALYLQTAEDLEWLTFKEKDLGVEINGYAKHKLYDNVELALHLGYLVSGDAMDFFETTASRNGKSDVDIFKAEARVRYQF